MREDMDKVIVERPRHGSRATSDDPKGWNKKKYGTSHPDLEDLPHRESMSMGRKYGYDSKQLNEHLRPLYRFLDKQVNRPWDKVYSEICEGIKLTSTVQRHILSHVFDHVAQNITIRDDGVPMVTYTYGPMRPLYDSGYPLYIHPKDGLLKKVKKPKNWTRESQYAYWPPAQHRIESERANGSDWASKTCHQFHKIKGLWYIIELRPMPLPLSEETVFKKPDGTEEKIRVPTDSAHLRDAMLGHRLYDLYDDQKQKYKEVHRMVRVVDENGEGTCHYYTETTANLYGRNLVYAASFKQANSKELKEAKLKNDPQEQEK